MLAAETDNMPPTIIIKETNEMSKYINADEFKGIMRGFLYRSGKSTITREALEGVIDNLCHAAEVEKVVYCKYCQHCKYLKEIDKYYCERNFSRFETSPHGFCDKGKE